MHLPTCNRLPIDTFTGETVSGSLSLPAGTYTLSFYGTANPSVTFIFTESDGSMEMASFNSIKKPTTITSSITFTADVTEYYISGTGNLENLSLSLDHEIDLSLCGGGHAPYIADCEESEEEECRLLEPVLSICMR